MVESQRRKLNFYNKYEKFWIHQDIDDLSLIWV